MTSELRTVVFQGGQSERVDPRVGDMQTFYRAQNVRFRKDGRAAKRYGNAIVDIDELNGAYSKAHANSLAEWQGTPLLAFDAQVRVPHGTLGGWASRGEIPRFMPGRHDPIARDEFLGSNNASVAYCNGYLVYAWDDGTTVRYQARTTAGAVAAEGTIATGTYPQLVAVGTKVWCAFKNATPAVELASIDCATVALTVSATGATAGTLASSGAFFDAGPVSSTQWVIAYQSGATTISVKLLTGSTVSATATATTTTATPLIGVHYSAQSSAIYAGWDDDGDITVKVFSTSLGATLGGPTIISAATVGSNNRGPITFCDYSSTQVRCAWRWTGSLTGPLTAALRESIVTNAAVTGTVRTHYHMVLASKLFVGPLGTTDIIPFDGSYCWVHTFNRTGYWDTQRNYYLVSLSNSPGTSCMMHLAAIGSMQSMTESHLPPVVKTPTAYVVSLPNALRTYFGAGATTLPGVDSVSCYSCFDRQRDAHRSTAEVGRATHFAGGVLTEYVGFAGETQFMHAPIIEPPAAVSSGGSVDEGEHRYVAVFEMIDAQGRRHRSAPSEVVSADTTASDKTVTLTISTLAIAGAYSNGTNLGPYPTIHVYRTTAGGAAFYRCTPNLGAPRASAEYAGAPTTTFVDTSSDATISVNEILYTDGGVLPNVQPPASRFTCSGSGRLWLGGLLEPSKAVCSKLVVEGEPVQFTDSDAFAVFFPEPLTGIVWLDGALIGFSSNGIYVVTGDGPNDQGVGSFTEPRRLPTDVGCIDYRSIVETPQGVFFQSKRGIYLLPRGFSPPVFIGADVQETLASYPVIVSAVQVVEQGTSTDLPETTVRFVATDAETATAARVLVFDTRTNAWSVDTSAIPIGVAGMWSSLFTFTHSSLSATDWLRQESPGGNWGDENAFASTRISTGDYRPFGLAGYGKFHRVAVLGEYRGEACVLNVNVSVDGRSAATRSWTISAQTSPSQDGTFYVDITPEYMTGTSISVDVYDAALAGVVSEGLVFHGITIETEAIGRTRRLGAGSKA